MSGWLDRMEHRARAANARKAVRAWEYRQRDLAGGVWFRFRRVLCEAESAWAVPDDELARLIAEGFAPEPVGAELEPRRTILFVPAERLAAIAERRPIALVLGRELLAARTLVLARFPRLSSAP